MDQTLLITVKTHFSNQTKTLSSPTTVGVGKELIGIWYGQSTGMAPMKIGKDTGQTETIFLLYKNNSYICKFNVKGYAV